MIYVHNVVVNLIKSAYIKKKILFINQNICCQGWQSTGQYAY